MCIWSANVTQPCQPCSVAECELGLQVLPLELELADCSLKPNALARANDLPPVKSIPTQRRLLLQRSQVGSDACHRGGGLPEPEKLRMLRVARGLASQHRLSEKALSPDGHEAAGVKVLRVKSPQSHVSPQG